MDLPLELGPPRREVVSLRYEWSRMPSVHPGSRGIPQAVKRIFGARLVFHLPNQAAAFGQHSPETENPQACGLRRWRDQPVCGQHNTYGEPAPIALHPQGDPPEPGLRATATRRIPAQADSPAAPTPGPLLRHERSGLGGPRGGSDVIEVVPGRLHPVSDADRLVDHGQVGLDGARADPELRGDVRG